MNEITKELLEALKMATLQNQLDMLMTGEELRKCESAIAKAEAILAAPQPASGPAFPRHPEIIQMTDRHTPGPWKVSMNQIKSNYDTVAQVFTHLVQGRYEVNARLIAAAPELLSAAVELRAALKEEAKERGGPWVSHRVSRDTQRRVGLAHQALIAAIAKATGEQE